MTSISELLPRAAKLKYEVMLQLQLVESGKADASDCAMGLSELQRQRAPAPAWNDAGDAAFFAGAGAGVAAEPVEVEDRRAAARGQLPRGRFARLPKGAVARKRARPVAASASAKRIKGRPAQVRPAQTRSHSRHRRHASAANDNLEEEGSSLHRSGAQVDELMESGNATIKSLAQQRERLKATHRNMLSMINTLGISNSVMKLISSREKNDRYIFFAGVTITLVVLYLCIRFSRS